MSTPAFRPEQLLEHEAFLRALARELLRDAASVEDVLQDAWLQALTRPPRSAGALRSWLARVVTHRALNLRREQRRRVAREAASARPEEEAQEDVEDRIATERRVLDALARLGEPARTTLWLRWYEGLPPGAIAARLGVPVETVHSRLKRGLADLRGALDREFGDRRSWCVALAPWFAARAPGSGAVWLLAGALALLAWIGLRAADAPEPAGPPDVSPAASARAELAPEPARIVPRAAAEARVDPDVPAREPLAGRALDARSGEALAQLALDARSGRTQTREDGGFTLEDARGLRVEDGGVELRFRRVGERLEVEIGPTFRLRLAGAWAGRAEELVATLDGGAPVDVHSGPEPWVRFPALPALSLLARTERSSCALVVATRDGRFSGAARVHARYGAQATAVPIELVETPPRTLTPAAEAEPAHALRGRVASRSGRALAGGIVRARATAGGRDVLEAMVDAQGGFAFDALREGEWIVTPPLDTGFAWEPALALVQVPAPGEPAFVRRDDVPARRVRVQAFEERTGRPLERVRFALLPDRTAEGKRAALDYQGEPVAREVAFDGVGYDALPAGARCFWLADGEGFLSARGTEAELRRAGDELLLELRLEPSWKTNLAFLGEDGGGLRPLAGVKLVTARGAILAESLEDGRLDLELAYDPGRLSIDCPGWSVASWEGWWRGRPRAELDPHLVLLTRE